MVRFRRFLIIAISLFISYILEFIFLPQIPGLIKVPNLFLCTVVTIGFLFGKTYGMVTGLAAGYLLDALGTGTMGFYILLFAWMGFLNGLLSEKLESEVLLLILLLFLSNEVVFHLYTYGLSFLISKKFVFSSYFSGVFMPEIVLTFVAFILYYGVIVFLAKRWDLRQNKGEVKIV